MQIEVNPKCDLSKYIGRPCPCRIDKSDVRNICPCDDFRFNQNCICKLFIVDKEEKE